MINAPSDRELLVLDVLESSSNPTRAMAPKWLSFLILPLFLAQSCRNDPAQIRLLTGGGLTQADKATDITGVYSKQGKVVARLFAHEYIKNDAAKPPFTDLNRGIRIEFYNDSGKLEHILTGDSCRYYDAEGNALIWGNVQIVSIKGEQLNTDELIWNQTMKKFFTEKAVKITTATDVMYGTGMEANQDFTWYHIARPNGRVQVKKGEMTDQ